MVPETHVTRNHSRADQRLMSCGSAATGIRWIVNLMCVARSLEAVESQEAGHGWQRRGSIQTRFLEEEGPKTEATHIAEQILAKLGPNLGRAGTRKDVNPLPSHNR